LRGRITGEELRAGAAAVEPVPARLAGKRLFTVAEIENWLARSRGRRRPALRPEDVAPQFDTEDGSDRREWQPAGAALVRDERLKAELGRARSCLYDVEFFLDVPAADGLFSDTVAVNGRIDCLWEDAEGRRHLLTLPARSAGGGRWPLGPVLAALAVRRQTGAWPASVTVYDPATGAVLREDGGRLPHAEAVAAVAAAVSGLRRETLPA
jgi:hypothetical protein